MDLDLRALTPTFGVEVVGLDLARPLDGAAFDAVYRAFLDHQLIVFRNQVLPPALHVELARHFGEVQVHVMNQYHADGHPELYRLSNLDDEGRPNGRHPDRGTLAWHTDGSWQRVTGQATLIYSEVVPAHGGETHFCDMYAAYEDLDGETRARVDRLRAIHNLDFSRSRRHGEDPMTDEQRLAVPPVDHPVVRTHPETGRRAIFLGDHAECIEGMDYAAGRALVEALNARVIDPSRTYCHRWQPNELVIWDNRCVLHRATGYDTARERRVMRRATVLGEVPH